MPFADAKVEAEFQHWCAEKKAQRHAYHHRPAVGGVMLWPGRRNSDGSYVAVYRKLDVRTPLPMPRVVLQGPKWRHCLMTYRTITGKVAHHPRVYDFFDDVRELVCEQVRFDVYAEWADPREWLAR